MKFKYTCKSNKCKLHNNKIIINKCPCHIFVKEYCQDCGSRLDRYKEQK